MKPQSRNKTDPDTGTSNRKAVSVRERREKLLATLFPNGVPQLWCPLLTHFRTRGKLDETRICCHLNHVAPHVHGILVPGSTGEGWEMNDAEIRRLLGVVLEAAQRAGVRVLVGVLKYSVPDMLRCIEDTLAWLKSRTGATTAIEALSRSSVVGFTVCPPKGADLSQASIREALAEILASDLPVALYQLPQVTENEMTPETVRHLAERYSNLFLFKDTSGGDRVARAKIDLGGVYLVRGAEGEYAQATRGGNGPYDGLLLSTANVFAAELHQILGLLESAKKDMADALSGRIEPVVEEVFALVEKLEIGNPFTNANKILDHVMAYGAAAVEHEPPLLYSGVRLPAKHVKKVAETLRAKELYPERGYLNSTST